MILLRKYLLTIVFGFIFFLLLPLAVCSQNYSSVDNDLILLENLINDTIANTEEQQILLDSLRQNLQESENLIADYENIITEQESLLTDLHIQLNEMSETYRTLSDLSARFEQRSKFWRTFTLIAIPVTALISGGIVALVH